MNAFDNIGKGLSQQEKDAMGNYLAGFLDGDSALVLHYNDKNPESRFGVCKCYMTITLRADDYEILQKFKDFVGCGGNLRTIKIYNKSGKAPDRRKPQIRFEIASVEDLATRIIPLLDKYPLRTKKLQDYLIWREAVLLCYEVFKRKTFNIINGRRGKWLKEEVDRFKELETKLELIQEYIHPGKFEINKYVPLVIENREAFANWLAGFTDAEGNFGLSLNKRKNNYKSSPTSNFNIRLRRDDFRILYDIKEFWGFGSLYKIEGRDDNFYNSKPQIMFTVIGREDNHSILLFFKKYILRAKKKRDFEIWEAGVELLFSIFQRRRVSKGGLLGQRGGGGWYDKWSDEERSYFADLCIKLKQCRKYKENLDSICLPTKPKVKSTIIPNGFFKQNNEGKWIPNI